MGQEQHTIPLRLRDGQVREAVRTGNNAAWLCGCDRRLPLVGKSDDARSPLPSWQVTCPSCGRSYRVSAPGRLKVPTHVEELPRS